MLQGRIGHTQAGRAVIEFLPHDPETGRFDAQKSGEAASGIAALASGPHVDRIVSRRPGQQLPSQLLERIIKTSSKDSCLHKAEPGVTLRFLNERPKEWPPKYLSSLIPRIHGPAEFRETPAPPEKN